MGPGFFDWEQKPCTEGHVFFVQKAFPKNTSQNLAFVGRIMVQIMLILSESQLPKQGLLLFALIVRCIFPRANFNAIFLNLP